MFKHILVPLDGSRLSEASLAPAKYLAGKLKASVTLLHVIEQAAPREVHQEHHLQDPTEAEAYLRSVAKRTFRIRGNNKSPSGITVFTHVHRAPVTDVAGSLVAHAHEEIKPTLIIMSTHGRGGIRDLLFGSIAQQVVNQGTTPLLLIKPNSKQFKLKTVLVPLDPDSAHDDSLPTAEFLAKALAAKLILLSVVPTYNKLGGEQAAAGSLLPATTQAFLDIREQNARDHLLEHAANLGKRNIQANTIVARGDPANMIVETARSISVDLIVLTTHGKTGAGAFWSRSIAPNVARNTRLPLWLIRLT